MKNPFVNLAADKPISIGEKISFGLAGSGIVVPDLLIGMYLMIFYTDVVGLNAAVVGTLFMISRAWDAINDILMGALCDNTNSRWGKARPYLLWCAVPAMILASIVGYNPDFSKTGKLVFAAVTLIGLAMVYTGISVPTNSLLARLTDNPKDRGDFTISFVFFNCLFSLVFAAGFYPLVELLGGGSMSRGYFFACTLSALVMGIFLLIGFLFTRERVAVNVFNRISLKAGLKALSKNPPWLILGPLTFFRGFIILIFATMMTYYCTYYLKDKGAIPKLMGAFFLGAVVIQPFLKFLLAKIEKRSGGIFGGFMFLIAGVIRLFFPGVMVMEVASAAIFGMGYGIFDTVVYNMYADTMEYSEWKTGIRVEGYSTACRGYLHKLGGAFAGWSVGLMLEFTGYIPNGTQPSETLTFMKYSLNWPLIALGIFQIVIMLFYNLEKDYPTILKELEKRRASDE